MYKSAPQTNEYDLISKLQKIKRFAFWLIIVLSIITSLNIYKYITIEEFYSDVISIFHLTSMLTFTAISYVIDYVFMPKAQNITRCDFFDHSFGTKFYVHQNSEEYYTNSTIPNGFYKMAVNLYESIFFTYSLACGMRLRRIIMTTILILVLIPLFFYGIKNTSLIVLIVIQILISVYFLGGLIKLLIYVKRNEELFNELTLLFSLAYFKIKADDFTYQIIRIYTDYESNKAWSYMQIDSRLYRKMNTELSKKWDKIKIKYNIS